MNIGSASHPFRDEAPMADVYCRMVVVAIRQTQMSDWIVLLCLSHYLCHAWLALSPPCRSHLAAQ
eukprot:scaffold1695_cov23-Prasinocladus_malaysianus.AAC.1